MCGIAAIIKLSEVSCSVASLERMRDEVAHRGPDDSGVAVFGRSGSALTKVGPGAAWQVGLGHRRLSILDLSPAGHQPMVYRNRFWISYNGEVYNFIELRGELERLGHSFCSGSDTEVILAAYTEWGPDCFRRFRGMWGLIILDCETREVILCRDRMGIKPLYLWEGSGLVAVSSEIKQFLHVPGFKARVNIPAAGEYLQTGYENPNGTFFRDVQPLQAGCWLKVSIDGLKLSSSESYWQPDRIQVSVKDPIEAGEMLATKLRECVRIHLRSDVPVGCALSGGLDSSSVAVLTNALRNGNGEPLHTFTSTFPGDPLDEREFVDAVLSTIRAEPHFVTPAPEAFLEDFDRFLWIHDEPVGSFSMYAAYSIARLTRQCNVPVTLNGQGGDEVLAGYWQTYFLHLRDLWRDGQIPALFSQVAGALMPGGNSALVGQVPAMLERYFARSRPQLPVRFRDTEVLNEGSVLKNILAMPAQARRVHQIRVMFLPQLLKWDDRNFMAFSVEGRYPFLDHELIDICLSMAPDTLYHSGWTKWPLRRGLREMLPPKILHRRSKFGFETPHNKWLSKSLRPVLESWLQSDRPIWDNVDRKDVQNLLQQTENSNGKSGSGETLFRIFVLDRWLSLFGLEC